MHVGNDGREGWWRVVELLAKVRLNGRGRMGKRHAVKAGVAGGQIEALADKGRGGKVAEVVEGRRAKDGYGERKKEMRERKI